MKFFGYNLSLGKATEVRAEANTDLKNPAEWLQTLLGAAQNATGITVTPLRALGVASVFACVRVVADTVGTLPLEVMQQRGRAKRPAPGHRLYSVLHDMPNDDMTSTDMRCAMQANLSLRSNCYAEILRDVDGDPVGLYPVESQRVTMYRDSTTRRIKYRLDNGTTLDKADVVHVRANSFNGLVGADVLGTVRECIALAIALQDNAAKFFGNGSRPGGVLEHPAALSEEAQERLRKQFEDQVGGKNLYRMMVLEEGLKYVAQRSENKDSQFDESRVAQDLNICRVFGVPPHKIGILNAQPRANVEQDNLSFIMDTIRPHVVRWEQTLNAKLLTAEDRDQGFYVRFNLNAIQRGDMKSRYDAMAVGRQWGWLSANDCREAEELEPIEGGDIYLQPLNMVEAKRASEILMLGKGAPTAPTEKEDTAEDEAEDAIEGEVETKPASK